jgi:DNA-binding transcriptional LysR family regulator
MNWSDCLNTFMQVVECKSLSKAAAVLELSVSSVSKQISWLENYLGTQVLIRTTRTLALTDKGRELYASGQQLLSHWENVRENIADDNKEVSGVIRIDTTPRFDDFLLIEILDEFLTRHPHIKIHHRDVSEESNMENSGTDLYIGMRPPAVDDAKLIKKELIRIPRDCVTTQKYIDQYGKPQHPSELVKHRCISYKEAQQWEFNGQSYPINIWVSSSSPKAVVKLTQSGLGIACFAKSVTILNNEKNNFVPILTDWSCSDHCLDLYFIKKSYMPKRIRLFIDFVTEKIDQRRRLFFKLLQK